MIRPRLHETPGRRLVYMVSWDGGLSAGGLPQTSVDRVEDGLEAAGDVELLEDVVHMALDRLFADEKGLAYVFVRSA